MIIEVLKALLAHGAKLENTDKHGQTVLMYAAEQKKLSAEAIRFLLEHRATTILNHQDSSGNTALMHAVRSDNIPALKVLLEYNPFYEPVNVQGHTAFSLACDQGNLEAMDLLHEAGANINHRNQRNYNRTPLFEAVRTDKDNVAVKLLEYGADIELAENYSEETPLLKAVQRNNQGIAVDLVIRGANIHARASSGKTPLIEALESDELILAILLLSKSAEDIPVRNGDDYLWGLTKLVAKDDAINHDGMQLLLSKGILRSFQGTTLEAKVPKDRLMHAATPTMKKLIQNYRKPMPPQLPTPKAPAISQEAAISPLRLPKEEFQANCKALQQLQQMGLLSKAMSRINPNVREQLQEEYRACRLAYFNKKYG
jgi:ankyrin repeat protein